MTILKKYFNRQKSYHDKKRKDIEFQVEDHIFLRVNPVIGVGRGGELTFDIS
ncbi:hypothetical protein MTR_5g022370 [Medicago truncatula]|uniref:Uncharacterized protein n=1 Tax=Medicago truncatula TaxID=3880 RepID=G7JXH9_MEDTR|nr:hypothetical protein MTR_5g022370 [Medicago truncatula]